MTQLTYADRVQEYATNPGATTFLLAGASAANLRTFADGGLEGETTAYSAVHRTSGQWEVGIGVYAAGYLTRVTILSNSSGTLLPITFSSGVVDVANDIPASEIVTFDSAGGFAVPGILTVTGAATFGSTGTFTGAVAAPSFIGALVGNASTATYATSAGASSTATLAAAATILATGRTIGMTGDLTWTSPSFSGAANVTAVGTLATVNSNTGPFGSSTAIPVITVNAKGLVTAVTTAAVVAPAGTVTGTTLAANVVASSLTSTGTLTALTISGALTFTSAADQILFSAGAGRVRYGNTADTLDLVAGGGVAATFTATVATFSGSATATSFTVTGGAFGAGRFYTDSQWGSILAGKTGSAADFTLFGPTGSSPVLYVPTGTLNLFVTNRATVGGDFVVLGTLLGQGASRATLDQYSATTSRLLAWGPNVGTPGILKLGVESSDGSVGSDGILTVTSTLATFGAALSIPASTPASAVAAGVAGTLAWDATHAYVCVATNTWVRATLASW